MCLDNRTPSKFRPTTTKTAYKSVVKIGKVGKVLYSSYMGTALRRGVWLKAKNPQDYGFCVFQTRKAAKEEASLWYDEVVVKVKVRGIAASGTFRGYPCWAAAEMFIPKE